MNHPRRSFLSTALSAALGLLLPRVAPAGPDPVKVVERKGPAGWAPIWLAHARAGDRLRLLSDPARREWLLATDPVRRGPIDWDCEFELAPPEKASEPCSSS